MVTLEGHRPDISTDQEWLEVAGHKGCSSLSVTLVYMPTGTYLYGDSMGTQSPCAWVGHVCLPFV